jgi:hypothetical protein
MLTSGSAQEVDLFSFMPAASDAIVQQTAEFKPSGSKWGDGLDEKQVFHRQLQWGNEKNGWSLRIGKGGQIYSFRGPFGEAMPPQIHKGSEWNDEVWQLVSVCTKRNDDTLFQTDMGPKRPLAYFIHGSGTYKRDPAIKKTFYNPILAEKVTDSSYSILNWGQHAHVPTIYRSNALYYTRFNVHEDGAIELNYAIHNFGDDVLNYFNTPWGGVRHSTLPEHLLSKPDGSVAAAKLVSFSNKGIKDASQTGGWSGFFTANDPEAWGIALVFGHQAQAKQAKLRYRWGYAGAKANARDYFVSVVAAPLKKKKGQTLKVQVFVIVDQLKNISRRVEALKAKTRYDLVSIKDSPERTVTVEAENHQGRLKLAAWPKQESRPLFLVQEAKTKKRYVIDDLYRFSSRDDFKKFHPAYEGDQPVLRSYDGNTRYLRLLGFLDEDRSLQDVLK